MSQPVFPAGGLRGAGRPPRAESSRPHGWAPVLSGALHELGCAVATPGPGLASAALRRGMVSPQPLNPGLGWAAPLQGLPGALGRGPQHCRPGGARRAQGNPPGGSLYPAGPERAAQTVWPPACPRTDWAGTWLRVPCPPPGCFAPREQQRTLPLGHAGAIPSPPCWLGGGFAAWSPQPLQPLLLPPGSGQCLEPGVAGTGQAAAEVGQSRSARSSARRCERVLPVGRGGPGHLGSTREAGRSWWVGPSVTGHGDRSRFQQEQGSSVLA